MATVFDTAMGALFADANMAVPGIYRAGGVGAGISVRVILRQPDQRLTWNDVSVVTGTTTIEVRAVDIPAPVDGDSFAINGIAYAVQGTPIADAQRLVWAIELIKHEI